MKVVADLQKMLQIVRAGVGSLGAALMDIRGKNFPTYESAGGQLKTVVDKAAEAWLITYLRSIFPADHFLAEEEFEESQKTWHAPQRFWTVDALDGTRSFVEGFDGFCIQVAYIVNGFPKLGIIHAPAWQTTYWAIAGYGAYKQYKKNKPRRLLLPHYPDFPAQLVVTDSTFPRKTVGKLMKTYHGRFLECGSFGLKICLVAEGKAHIFVKEASFKLWDVAPGDLILNQAGGKLVLWDGTKISYDSGRVYFENLIAAPESLIPFVIQFLSDAKKQGE